MKTAPEPTVVDALDRFFVPPTQTGRRRDRHPTQATLPGRRRDRPLHSVEVAPGDLIVVAFSGGPDSTALLRGLAELAPSRDLRLLAAHLDHGLDPGSAGRARTARSLAEDLGIEAVVERRAVDDSRRPGESPEAAARRIRYGFLEEVRRDRGGRWIATAHHRDDQAETVLLRLLMGSGAEGLGGIEPVRGRVVRPLLPLSRNRLAHLSRAGAPPVEDPSNRDLRIPRNRLRHALLPTLEAAEPGTAAALARLARCARGARKALDRRLTELLAPRHLPAEAGGGVAVERAAYEALPEPLRPHALALLHRRAGAPYPAGQPAREELARQLQERSPPGEAGDRIGCDAPGGWRWESSGPRLVLRRRRPPAPSFSYRLPLPGEVEIPEIGVVVRIRRERVAPWMFRGSPHRAALALPPDVERSSGRGAPAGLLVRSRRPGDRLRPLGAPGTRKLKDVLIDRRVPRHERDRLPLLCVGERIAWVPGVTVDETFRLPDPERDAPRDAPPEEGAETWTAEVIR